MQKCYNLYYKRLQSVCKSNVKRQSKLLDKCISLLKHSHHYSVQADQSPTDHGLKYKIINKECIHILGGIGLCDKNTEPTTSMMCDIRPSHEKKRYLLCGYSPCDKMGSELLPLGILTEHETPTANQREHSVIKIKKS